MTDISNYVPFPVFVVLFTFVVGFIVSWEESRNKNK